MSEEEKKETQEDSEPNTQEKQEEATPETNQSEPAEEAPKAEETKDEEKQTEEEMTPAEAESEPQKEEADVLEEEAAPKGYKSKLVGLEELNSGMTVRVHERIKDISPKGEERERIQVFQGMILGIRGAGLSRTMTVRKVSKGYGVEKIYPINSPVIDKIELVKTAKTRQAKLGYLKNLKRRFKRKLKETWAK